MDILEKKLSEGTLKKVIFKFPVLHLGWEADGWGYVVDNASEREIWLSDHGNFYIASVKELEQKIAEYTKVKFETKKAIALANNNGKLD
jgi:hypothetical protein